VSHLHYFPEIYPDEMLYSVLARYHRHVGNPASSMSNIDLFGRRNVRSTFDLPSYVSDLAVRIPKARGLTAKMLVTEHTHMPYYTAFLTADRRAELVAKQLEGYASLHMKMGITAFVIPQITSLRFCPECTREMLASKGELWWKRAHQLPGVLVCHEHGCSLAESEATFWTRGQHGFVAATRATCGENAKCLVADLSSWDLARLLDVAQRSEALLRSSEMKSFEVTSAGYRERLYDIGLMKSRAQVDVEALVAAFRAHHGGILGLTPGLLDDDGGFDKWLLQLVRRDRNAAHPLLHILLQSFLDGRPLRTAPFGSGPWRCPNPVAGHGAARTITTVVEKNGNYGVVGTFACPCGYAYTMSLGSDGVLRGPRFKTYGPLLDPALTRLVAEGTTLRGAAAALGVHPRAVAAAAERLQLGTGWKTPEKVGSRIGQSKPASKRPRKRHAKPAKARAERKPRVDWGEIDRHLAEEVADCAAKLLDLRPPVMVRMRSLETAIARPNFIYTRKAKLPLAVQAVTEATETLEQFQLRRIAISLEHARDLGRVTVSRVMRGAGVKAEWKPYVQELIQALPV